MNAVLGLVFVTGLGLTVVTVVNTATWPAAVVLGVTLRAAGRAS